LYGPSEGALALQPFMYRPSKQVVELEIQVREVTLMQGHVARDAATAVLKYARLDLDIFKRFGRSPRRNS
jgi:uncharacterized protein (DUF924 family)